MPSRFRGLGRIEVLGLEVPVAETTLSRLLGLAWLHREHAGPGLLIPRCGSVHTFGMRFRLDLAFLDANDRVIEVRVGLGPCRIARCRAAAAVLEVPSR